MTLAAADADAVRHRMIPVAASTDWDEALAGIPHTIAHTNGYCRALERAGDERTFLYRYDGRGQARIVCPLLLRSYNSHVDVATPYGFSGFVGCGRDLGFADEWRRFAEANGWVCGYLALNPLFGTQCPATAPEIETYHRIYTLDLRLSEGRLFAGLSMNRKRELRRRDDEGINVVFDDRAALEDFFASRYETFMRARGASSAYRFSEAALRALCRLDDVLVVGARRAGDVQAVSLFGHTRYVADFLFNVSEPPGRRHSTRLIWEAVRALKARRIERLNLGGGVRVGDGLDEYKSRFGAAALPLRRVKQVYSRELYASLCRRAGADPDDQTYFPAYRSPANRPGGKVSP